MTAIALGGWHTASEGTVTLVNSKPRRIDGQLKETAQKIATLDPLVQIHQLMR